MKKYFILFIQVLSQFSTYRLHIILSIFQSFVTPLFLITALSFANSTSGITVSSLVSYYVLIALFYPLSRSNIDEKVYHLTFTGEINNFLNKPISIFKFLFFKEFAEKLVTFIFLIPFVAVGYYLLSYQGYILNNLNTLVFSLLLVPASFFLSFSFSYLIGLLSFWLDEFWAITNVKFVIVSLLGGVLLPYQFFPEKISNFLRYTPFPYMISLAPRLLHGNFYTSEILIVAIWIIVFCLLVYVFENKAISKYSHTGS